MNKVLACFLSYLVLTSTSAHAVQEEALNALNNAKMALRMYLDEDISLPANEMLRLINLAEEFKATKMNAVVGHCDEESSACEFGSTSSDFRLYGYIPKTKLALSANVIKNTNGRPLVSIMVVFPKAISAFGVEDTEFQAKLSQPSKDQEVRLVLQPKSHSGDHLIKDDYIIERARVYTFSRMRPQKSWDWSKAIYKLEPTGIQIYTGPLTIDQHLPE